MEKIINDTEIDSEFIDENEEIEDSSYVTVFIVCNECLHQWDDVIQEESQDDLYCILCGSSNVKVIS